MIWASTCCEMHGTGTIAHCLRMVRCRAAHMRVCSSPLMLSATRCRSNGGWQELHGARQQRRARR